MTASLVLDGLIAVLLVATIAYCALLSRKLQALRRNNDELRRVIASFDAATAKAEAGVARLKETGDAIGEALQEQMDEARARYDELAFLADRAEKLASALEPQASRPRRPSAPRRTEGAAKGPGKGSGRGPGQGATRDRGSAAAPDLSRAERELLRALESAR